MVLDFSRRGRPTDNAFAEAFNARFPVECPNEHPFMDLDDARAKVEGWRVDDNEVRPHSAIGARPPMALRSGLEQPLEAARKPDILTESGPSSGERPPAGKLSEWVGQFSGLGSAQEVDHAAVRGLLTV